MNRMTHHGTGRGQDWSAIKTRKAKTPPPLPSQAKRYSKAEIAALIAERPDLQNKAPRVRVRASERSGGR